jgi:cobalt-zinc-cadmium efflux system membrane fusion protein
VETSHDDHEGHEAEPGHVDTEEEHGHGEEQVKFTSAQLEEFGIGIEVAGEGLIAEHLDRPAEIKFDGDRVVHVVPHVDGIVKEVKVTQGETVDENALLAVISSRDLAELKATYLGDYERRALARETFEREQALRDKKISSEKDYLDAKTALAEAEIALRGTREKLKALSFSSAYIEGLADTETGDLTRYEITAPIAGTVIERHLSLGEVISSDKAIFVIADTSALWVEVTLYPKDLSLVQAGQTVRIALGDGDPVEGTIAFVTPHVSEETRTATARVPLTNADGRLRAGMFVTASIEIGEQTAAVRVPKSAVQRYEEKPVVFVQEDGEAFEPRPVKLGRSNSEFVEVLSGINAGEKYVAKGAFTLKAELEKASFGDGHNH